MRSATNPQARIDSMRLNHKQIAACTGGSFMVEPLDPRALATGLTWDSRDAKPGDVYVALPGERVDGHDFVGAALSGGAVCALVMQPLDEAVRMLAAELGASVIEVPDTAHAVADIAREWRSHLHGRVIALTGSTGKTTTKNLVRDVLASTLSTVATAGNQNNELGVPKTLLAAEQDTQAVVVEMGMRGAGQLAGGAGELSSGMNQLNASTITLPETMKRQIADMTAEFDFPKFDPVSFVSPQNANVEAVQFVMTTAAIEQPEAPEPEEPEQEQTIWDRFLALFQG